MSKDPKRFNNPNRKTLDSNDVGALGEALLTLTQELWIVKDRVRILEAVLETNNINVHEAINQYQPDEALQKSLNSESDALVAKILNTLNNQY